MWHYVVYGTDDYNAGSTTLVLPDPGHSYTVFIAGMAWDASTRGDYLIIPGVDVP